MRASLVATMACAMLIPAALALAITYTPPTSSADALQGVDLSGEPIADSFKQAFKACDDGNRQAQCDGRDPNRNTAIIKLKSGAILFDAKMAVDNDGSPFAAEPRSEHQTSLFYSDGKTSLNADKIRYLAVPGAFAIANGFELGDIAAVIYQDKVSFAVIGDYSKPYRIGEGSVALHTALGHEGCLESAPDGNCKRPRSDSIPSGVTYIVFPGTKAKLCGNAPLPRSPSRLCSGLTEDNLNQRIDAVGKEEFDALKGKLQ